MFDSSNIVKAKWLNLYSKQRTRNMLTVNHLETKPKILGKGVKNSALNTYVFRRWRKGHKIGCGPDLALILCLPLGELIARASHKSQMRLLLLSLWLIGLSRSRI
jgi:hypothetical protein